MSRGKQLSTAEQYAIKGMVNDGIEVKKIALHLGRTKDYIQKYIDENLSSTIAEEKQLIETAELSPLPRPSNSYEYAYMVGDEFLPESLLKKIHDALTLDKLKGGIGFSKDQAESWIKRIRQNVKYAVEDNDNNVTGFVNWIIGQSSSAELFHTKTDNRKDGVTVLTKAASDKYTDSRTKPRRKLDSDKPHLFQPKSGTTK